MASIFDDLFSIFRDNKDIAMAGAGIYDFFQDRKQGRELQNFEQNIPQVDPFGSANRSIYQNELAKLYQDPSYIANLPGYQFARRQGEKSIDRAAAKRGQFYSGNTLYQLSNFNQDLAGQFYDEEAKRLMQLSGANFPPNAGEAANLFRTGQQLQGNAPGNVLAGLDKAGAQGTLDGLMNILSGGKTAADMATGQGMSGGLMESLKGLLSPSAGGGIPGSGAVSGLTSVLGPTSSFGLGAGIPGGTAALASGAGSLGAGAATAGGFSLSGAPLTGMNSIFGTGFGVNAGATGGATAAAPAGGLMSGGLGTAVGAALPLALAAFGMSRQSARHAKEVAQMKPYMDQIGGTAESMLNIPGQGEVLGRLFNDPTGKQFGITGDITQGRQNAVGAYDMGTGDHGIWTPKAGAGINFGGADGTDIVEGGHFSSIAALAAHRDRQLEIMGGGG